MLYFHKRRWNIFFVLFLLLIQNSFYCFRCSFSSPVHQKQLVYFLYSVLFAMSTYQEDDDEEDDGEDGDEEDDS